MKTKAFFLNIVFLFLTSILYTSCDVDDNEIGLEIEENIPKIEIIDDEAKYGVDKDIERPGSQSSSGS